MMDDPGRDSCANKRNADNMVVEDVVSAGSNTNPMAGYVISEATFFGMTIKFQCPRWSELGGVSRNILTNFPDNADFKSSLLSSVNATSGELFLQVCEGVRGLLSELQGLMVIDGHLLTGSSAWKTKSREVRIHFGLSRKLFLSRLSYETGVKVDDIPWSADGTQYGISGGTLGRRLSGDCCFAILFAADMILALVHDMCMYLEMTESRGRTDIMTLYMYTSKISAYALKGMHDVLTGACLKLEDIAIKIEGVLGSDHEEAEYQAHVARCNVTK